jgi:SAM-dependent methyltransferase
MIDLNEFDFLDVGCGDGASIEFGKKYLSGGSELGIDRDTKKLDVARQRGHRVVECDVRSMRTRGRVRFTILNNVLQYLDDEAEAGQVLRWAVTVSREFVFVRQPYFDASSSLMRSGLKVYWADWTAHKNPMTTFQIYKTLRSAMRSSGVAGLAIFGNKRIRDTSSEAILPIDAAENSHRYDERKHGPKPYLALPPDCYWETLVVVYVSSTRISASIHRAFPEAELICVYGDAGKSQVASVSEHLAVSARVTDRGSFPFNGLIDSE